MSFPSSLQAIADKALSGERISKKEALFLFHSDEDDAIARLADCVRAQTVGEKVFFASTYFLHPSNLCLLSCPLCSFYAKPGMKKAWFHKPEELLEQVRTVHKKVELNEIHIVGGLWPDCDMNYYRELLLGIKEIDSNLHIKALTAVEYDFLSRHHKIPVEEVFAQMKSWGLGSLPGGGAEILVDAIRKRIAPEKMSSKRYIEIHQAAHKMGLPSNITMLYGHIESYEDIVEHLDQVRKLQDESSMLCAFVPLLYHRENNALGRREISPKNSRRIYALSRIFLDNIPQIKVLWNYVGVSQALDYLQAGANDMASTSLEEKIIVMAGGLGQKIVMTREKMSALIRSIHREPVEISSKNSSQLDPARC